MINHEILISALPRANETPLRASVAPARRQNLRNGIKLSGIGVLMVAATVACGSSSSSDAQTQTSTRGTVAPSSSDDWFGAVCAPGRVTEGKLQSNLRQAERTATCLNSENQMIIIGQYSSSSVMDGDLDMVKYVKDDQPYATLATDGGGVMVFIAPGSSTASGTGGQASLAPLERFGFTIH